MTASLREVAFALDPPAGQWSLRASLALGLWPPLDATFGVSLLELTRRLGRAGVELRTIASGDTHGWSHLHRAVIVSELRDRLRDPAIMRQSPTSLCGPFAVVLELARRDPWRFVRAVGRLLDEGTLSVLDGVEIEAEPDLRARPLPEAAAEDDDWGPGELDWMVTATMREEENVFEDVDDGDPVEGFSTPGSLERWTRDLLGLESQLQTCYVSEELKALQVARHAVDAGGVAFMMIDSNLIRDGGDDSEEEMRWRSARHTRRTPVAPPGPLTHSMDDALPWDHWVVYLGGLTPASPAEQDVVTLRLWSWGREYTMTGTAESFGEYLYAVVAGFPR